MNIQTFTTIMPNMEVRKIEKLENTFNEKTYVTLQIHFDDAEGNRLIFKDKNVERESFYKRGMIGTLTLRIIDEPIIKTSTKNTDYQYVSDRISITIEDFKEE
ncbi:MAG: hypothetical protein PUA49_08690 [Butyrivibrio sp.]|nr:hypothetical protein [Butyrivibrio sp.]